MNYTDIFFDILNDFYIDLQHDFKKHKKLNKSLIKNTNKKLSDYINKLNIDIKSFKIFIKENTYKNVFLNIVFYDNKEQEKYAFIRNFSYE